MSRCALSALRKEPLSSWVTQWRWVFNGRGCNPLALATSHHRSGRSEYAGKWDGSQWTVKHEAWLAAQHFAEPALKVTFDHYRATVCTREAALSAVEADLATFFDKVPFAEAVRRPGA